MTASGGMGNMPAMRLTAWLGMVLLIFTFACGKDSSGKKRKPRKKHADLTKANVNQKPWDCGEVAQRLGWEPGTEGYKYRVDWCEGDSVREDAQVFADLVAKNGKVVECADILARLGEPKNVQRYDNLIYGCVKQASDTQMKCAKGAADNAALIECGWAEYKRRYINLFNGETKLKEKYQKLADEMKAEQEEAEAKGQTLEEKRERALKKGKIK